MKATIYHNGPIITMEEDYIYPEAMAVRGNQILNLGDKDALISKYPEANLFDLEGLSILPGLHDSHCHLIRYGVDLTTVDLKDASSLADIKSKVDRYIKANGITKGQWITGKGWDEKNFVGNIIPTKDQLDTISNDHPLYFLRTCGHIAIANSLALEEANISQITPNPTGGEIVKDNAGNLTGKLVETATGLIGKVLPKYTKDRIKDLIHLACTEAKKKGLTSVQSEEFKFIGDYAPVIQAVRELVEENRLPIRMHMKMYHDNPKTFERFLQDEYKDMLEMDKGLISTGTLKIQLDGILGTSTAYMKENYQNQNNRGTLFHDREELYKLVETAHRKDIQVACHCIGSGSLELYLNVIEDIQKKYPDKKIRHRAIHCSITDKDLFDKLEELQLCVDIQPISVASDYGVVADKVGEDMASTSYAWKTMHDRRLHIGGSSDCPSESINPFMGMYVGVTREDLEGNPTGGWNPEEKLSIKQALGLYTLGSAYVCGKEKLIGSLKPGKLADFIIVDKNPLEIEEKEIPSIRVLYSSVDGRLEKLI